jgi:hypothetical protein
MVASDHLPGLTSGTPPTHHHNMHAGAACIHILVASFDSVCLHVCLLAGVRACRCAYLHVCLLSAVPASCFVCLLSSGRHGCRIWSMALQCIHGIGVQGFQGP